MSRRPYDSQYEDSYDPWPETRQNWIVWLIFFMPGSFIIWWEYMFPKRGEVWASRRRAENKIMQVLYSLGFWFALLAVGLMFYRHYQWSEFVKEKNAEQTIKNKEMAEDDERLGIVIVSTYQKCWKDANLVLPNVNVPANYFSYVLHFSADGDLTGPPTSLSSRYTVPRKLVEASAWPTQVVAECQLSIPDDLKSTAARWKYKVIRLAPY